MALLSLLLAPLAVAEASSPPADSAYICLLPFDYEQGQRDPLRPAAKRLSDCALCDFFGGLETSEEAEDETEEEAAETDSTASAGGPDLIVQPPSASATVLMPGAGVHLAGHRA